MAATIPSGMAITPAPIVINIVPQISGKIPNDFGSRSGSHLELVKNSIIETCLKNMADSLSKIQRIMNVTATVKIAINVKAAFVSCSNTLVFFKFAVLIA